MCRIMYDIKIVMKCIIIIIEPCDLYMYIKTRIFQLRKYNCMYKYIIQKLFCQVSTSCLIFLIILKRFLFQ